MPLPCREREEQAARAILRTKRRACRKLFPPLKRGRNKLGVISGGLSTPRYSGTRRRRSALATTLTEDSAMAAAAMTGDSRMPKTG